MEVFEPGRVARHSILAGRASLFDMADRAPTASSAIGRFSAAARSTPCARDYKVGRTHDADSSGTTGGGDWSSQRHWCCHGTQVDGGWLACCLLGSKHRGRQG